MVQDLINNTINNIKLHKVRNSKDIFNCSESLVSFSNKFKIIESEIKFFLRLKMYNNKKVLQKNNKGKMIVRKLFNLISKKPRAFISDNQMKNDKYRAISDYISGMTDRYAINLHKNYS